MCPWPAYLTVMHDGEPVRFRVSIGPSSADFCESTRLSAVVGNRQCCVNCESENHTLAGIAHVLRQPNVTRRNRDDLERQRKTGAAAFLHKDAVRS